MTDANCVFHIEENVKTNFKTKLNGLIWAAAKALKENELEAVISKINHISPRAAIYLRESNMQKWAAAVFPVPRLGCITSNSAESFNSKMKEVREKSPLGILMEWVSIAASKFFLKKQVYELVRSDLPQNTLVKYRNALNKGKRLRFTRIGDNRFTFQDNDSNSETILDLESKSCSCKYFDERLFPCMHAAFAIYHTRKNIADFVHLSYKVVSLLSVYTIPIIPIPKDSLRPDGITMPTIVTSSVGRPQIRRLRGQGERDPDSMLRCGNCNQLGHNIRSCGRRSARN